MHLGVRSLSPAPACQMEPVPCSSSPNPHFPLLPPPPTSQDSWRHWGHTQPMQGPRAGGEANECKRTSGGQKEGVDSHTEQAGEPSIKSFWLPRLEKKGRGAASSFKGWRPEEVPIFLLFPLQRKEALAKELAVSPHPIWGSGRPPPPDLPSHKLPSAPCPAAEVLTWE